MNKKRIGIAMLSFAALTAGLVYAADHIDAPAVASTTSDITDYYAFRSQENSDNLVFVTNTQGLLTPSATASAAFDEQVMIEINIDNDGDLVEDLVIQALVVDGELRVYGPTAPTMTGTTSRVEGSVTVDVPVTAYGQDAQIDENGGVKAFAGPRDDPFFFDLTAYSAVIAGEASSFANPGVDTFAGSNVMSIVVEVPKSMLGGADDAVLNTWVESKRRR